MSRLSFLVSLCIVFTVFGACAEPQRIDYPDAQDQVRAAENTEDADEAVEVLAPARKVQFLDLSSTYISEAGLEAALEIATLRRLSLSGTSVGDEGLEHLQGKAKLEWLDLSYTQVGDKGLAYLKQVPSLVSLNLSGLRLSASGIRQLSELPKLERLAIHGVSLDLAGVEALTTLPELRDLSLQDVKFSQVAHGSLMKMTYLRTLNLRGSDLPTRSLTAIAANLTATEFESDQHDLYRFQEIHYADMLEHPERVPLPTASLELQVRYLVKLATWDARELEHALSRAVDFGGLPEIELLGETVTLAHIRLLTQMPALESLYLIWVDLRDDWLVELGRCKNLKLLDVVERASVVSDGTPESNRYHVDVSIPMTKRANVTIAGMSNLANLSELERLSLVAIQLSNSMLTFLPELSNLRHLDVRDVGIDEGAVATLLRCEELRSVQVGYNPLDREALMRLNRGLPNLTTFGAGQMRVTFERRLTPTDAVEIARNRNLQFLNLSGHPIGDRGVSAVCKIKQLRTLYLDETGMTSAVVDELKELVLLQELRLDGSKLSNLHVKELRSALPDAEIFVRTGLQATPGREPADDAVDSTAKNTNQSDTPGYEDEGGAKSTAEVDDESTKGSAVEPQPENGEDKSKSVEGEESAVPVSVPEEDPPLRRRDRFVKKIDDEHFQEAYRKNIEKVRYRGTTGKSELGFLKDFPHLTSLDLSFTSVDDADLEHLKQLSKLKELSLMRSNITDAGVAKLTTLKELRSLHLGGLREHYNLVTSDCVESLLAMPRLGRLAINSTFITDDFLHRLKEHTGLYSLSLEHCQISDYGVAALGEMHSLTEIYLSKTMISSGALRHLQKLPKLRSLKIEDTGVDDSAVLILKDMPNLRKLQANRSLLTHYSLSWLKKHRDDLKLDPPLRVFDPRSSEGNTVYYHRYAYNDTYEAMVNAGSWTPMQRTDTAYVAAAFHQISKLGKNEEREEAFSVIHRYPQNRVLRVPYGISIGAAREAAELMNSLQYLVLPLIPLGDLTWLEKLTELEHLELQVLDPDADLAFLRKMPQLRYLVINGATFTPHNIQHLSYVESLETLRTNAHFTFDESAFRSISKLKHLRFLSGSILSTQATDLRKRLPKTCFHLGYLGASSVDLEFGGWKPQGFETDFEGALARAGTPAAYATVFRVAAEVGDSLSDLEITVDMYSEGLLADVARLKDLKQLTLIGVPVSVEDARCIARSESLETVRVIGSSIDTSRAQALLSGTKITHLDFTHCSITDAALPKIGTLTSLKYLALRYSQINGAKLSYLAGITGLIYLDLRGCHLEDDVWRDIAELRSLRQLGLSETGISTEGLSAIATLTKLQSIGLAGVKVAKDDLRPLSKLSELSLLNLKSATFESNTMIDLAACDALRSLLLDWSNVRPQDLKSLDRLDALEYLSLRNVEIPTDTVNAMMKFPTLNVLILHRDKISTDDRVRLRRKLGRDGLFAVDRDD